jgi:DNA-binding CsgD family transcriptional regulator
LDTTGGDVEMLAGTALFTHYWMDHCLFSRAKPWLKRCFALFDALEDPGKHAAIQLSHLTHAWIAANQHTRDFEEGVTEARHVIDAASAYRLPEVFMIGHTNLAMLQIHWGRTSDAESTLQEAMEHEERSGTLLPIFVYGLHYFFAGKAWKQAVVQMRLRIKQLERLHIDFLTAASQVSLTHILVAQGELQDAEQNLQAAEPATIANDEYIYSAPFLWELAKLHTTQGKMQQAQQEYEQLMARWKLSEDALTIFPMLLDGIIFYADTSDLTNAHRWLRELETAMHATDNPVGKAALREARSVVLAAQGDVQVALTMLRQAVAAWKTLQWRYRFALTAQRLASLLLQWASQPSLLRSQAQADRDEATLLLDQADAIYLDLNVSSGIADVKALRSKTHLEAQHKRRQTLMARSGWNGLTPREMEVLIHLARGASNKEIASSLHLSVGTVELHVSHILARLDCETRTQAVAIALERGWIKR